MPRKKLQKEISRHVPLASACGQGPAQGRFFLQLVRSGTNIHIATEPQTPEGVSVCTPVAANNEGIVGLSTLPYFELEDFLQTQCMYEVARGSQLANPNVIIVESFQVTTRETSSHPSPWSASPHPYAVQDINWLVTGTQGTSNLDPWGYGESWPWSQDFNQVNIGWNPPIWPAMDPNTIEYGQAETSLTTQVSLEDVRLFLATCLGHDI